MIARITMLNEDRNEFTMLFGDSYKKWSDQFQDYMCRTITWKDSKTLSKREIFGVTKVEFSKSLWKSFGGLKWCNHKNFQHELNRENVSQDEPDNPNPRQYLKMNFYDNHKNEKIVIDCYNQQLRHLVEE